MSSAITLKGRHIWTGDRANPWTTRVSIMDGAIIGVGDSCNPRLPVRDLGDSFVMPAFIDSHLHLLMGGESLVQLDLSSVKSRAEFERALSDRHAVLPSGGWLEAHGWNEANWGGALPDKTWLAGVGDRPTICWRMDRHAVLVNEAVLRNIDTSQHLPDGRFKRDSVGVATGIAYESAAWKVIQPLVPSPTIEQRRHALAAAEQHLLRLGVASVGAMEYLDNAREVIAPAARTAQLRVVLTLLDREIPIDFSLGRSLRDHAAALEADRRDGTLSPLSVLGYKSFADGTLGSRTAKMLEPYADEATTGQFLDHALAGTIAKWIQSVIDAGFSPSIHCIGDAAVRAVLDSGLAAQTSTATGDEVTHLRIEHCQTIHPSDVHRFAGQFASMQPLHMASDALVFASRMGRERLERFFPFQSLLRAGATLAFGSDWPIVSCDPLAGMAAAIAPRDTCGEPIPFAQPVSVDAALRAYTVDAARMLGIPAGCIRQGLAADFAVLDQDPFTADWTLSPPRVLETIVGGTSHS